MSSTLTQTESEALSAQVSHVLDLQGLGRSPALEKLLRFLESCARQGRAPKEVEIADAVFDRSLDEAVTDASVRVYVHRLRRKLEEFYAGPGQTQPRQLILPRGGYLLTLTPLQVAPEDEAEEEAPAPLPARRWSSTGWRHLAIGAVLACVLAMGWLLGTWQHNPLARTEMQKTALWRGVLDNPHRQAMVIGDYYIFGEKGPDGEIVRMRREFEVNSAHDLDALKAMGAPGSEHYADLGLTYLPIGVGAAIRSITPMLRSPVEGAPPVPVVPVSQLNGQVVQTTSLIYLGYLSGLGPLRSPVFEGSRFRIGNSYDEVVDSVSGHHYVAASHLEDNDTPGEDYALISSFVGLGGNRILVIAGTRDAALMAAADFVTRPGLLAQLEKVASHGASFEALIGVPALHNVGLDARLIVAAPRHNPSWTQGSTGNFPDDISEITGVKPSR